MDDLAALLAKFADAHGVSGYEEEVAALLREELEPLVDEVRTDTMGNVIGVRAGEGPTVMVAAHMDEIGGCFQQAESELGAVNMGIGAAAAGGNVMLSSSSPGIALMQEGMSGLCV